jgi:hypothetical protein
MGRQLNTLMAGVSGGSTVKISPEQNGNKQ